MFIIRTITKDAVEHNTSLGESFSLTDQRKSPEQFENLLKSSEVVDNNKPKVYALLGMNMEINIFHYLKKTHPQPETPNQK